MGDHRGRVDVRGDIGLCDLLLEALLGSLEREVTNVDLVASDILRDHVRKDSAGLTRGPCSTAGVVALAAVSEDIVSGFLYFSLVSMNLSLSVAVDIAWSAVLV